MYSTLTTRITVCSNHFTIYTLERDNSGQNNMHVLNGHLDEKHLTLTIRNYTKFQLWYIEVKCGTDDRSTGEQRKQ